MHRRIASVRRVLELYTIITVDKFNQVVKFNQKISVIQSPEDYLSVSFRLVIVDKGTGRYIHHQLLDCNRSDTHTNCN